MSFFCWLFERAFCSSWILTCVFLTTLVWLFIGCWLAFALRHSGYALAFELLAFGVNGVTLFLNGVQLQNTVLYVALLVCSCGIFYCIALTSITVRTYVLLRRQEREKIERATCYTLPARDNPFVRERLNTVLREEEESIPERLPVSFSYVRRMLFGLKNCTLSLTETLEVEELSKLFGMYTKKETFTSEDVNVLNEAFSRLLKLSAKHGVIAR